ncbi:hypothetical protein [Scopulibacillus cellulosilyticus]|uniref:Uncharacterized protein n=1 Tax=Scopulibacillus cellulosilyticus TaxID=2665665 RepID=A0ABW2PQI9_9BACL
MILYVFIILAVFILFLFNNLTNALCLKNDIPKERQAKLFASVNFYITVLLVIGYIQIYFNV